MSDQVDILEYTPDFSSDLRTITMSWIALYGEIDESDRIFLDNPGAIIEQGGAILFLRYRNQNVGMVSIKPHRGDTFELIKFGVLPEHRNRGFGGMLLEHILEKAKILGAKRVILFTSNQMKEALNLYKKHGFEFMEFQGSPYTGVDRTMMRNL